MEDELEERGIISIVSRHSVMESVELVKSALLARGIKIFAVVDHSGEAEKAGLTLRPTQLIIFGDPKAGTPLMEASPSLAIDLPLKALVWEDSGGRVRVSLNSPEYLRRRHVLPHAPFVAVGTLLAEALENRL